jgi:hypothetical protein
VGNQAICSGGGGGLTADEQVTKIVNNIFWDNSSAGNVGDEAQMQVMSGATPVIAHNVIQDYDGTPAGTNNSGDDPQFIDADGPDDTYGTEDDDPRLTEKSPAIDAGDNAALPPDEFDLDEDGDTAEPIPFDLDSRDRVVNEVVDIGAYEFPQGALCKADISPDGGNGTVDVDDLLMVINNWNNTGPDTPGDVNGDQVVDVDDLLAVINDWGACE